MQLVRNFLGEEFAAEKNAARPSFFAAYLKNSCGAAWYYIEGGLEKGLSSVEKMVLL